ncbi:MAG TPA: PD-(D/E)XK nuclease family protein [Terriglobia bacterium]|nr:PD-(D/E)XK nuclease family protein [Terriglobia bacterium]
MAPYKVNQDNASLGPTNEVVVPEPVATENADKPPRKRKGQQEPQPIPPVPVQMVMKRSVSPDGRIDSVSVEFSLPVSGYSHTEIKERAPSTLELQKEIVGSFLKLNGSKVAAALTPNQPQTPKPVFACMIDVGQINTRRGERLCINFQVNGRTSRLFGSAKQLAEHIQAAGYEIDPQNLEPGLRLNLACRVVTKPTDEGRYLNVEKVLPLGKKTGGANDRSRTNDPEGALDQAPNPSYSRINRYLTCPEQYRLYYIERLRPKVESAGLVFGARMHLALADLFRSWADPVETFQKDWESLKEVELRSGKRESWENFREKGAKLLEQFLKV